MEEAYLIQIHTVQTVEGERESLDVTTTATLVGHPTDYIITYIDETGDTGGTTTTLHVENRQCITISRAGEINSHMILELSKRNVSQHTTPYGTFMLGVHALEIHSDMTSAGGTLHFRYRTDIDLVPIGEIEFQIKLQPRISGGYNYADNL